VTASRHTEVSAAYQIAGVSVSCGVPPPYPVGG
jgi:hypothetical protein